MFHCLDNSEDINCVNEMSFVIVFLIREYSRGKIGQPKAIIHRKLGRNLARFSVYLYLGLGFKSSDARLLHLLLKIYVSPFS